MLRGPCNLVRRPHFRYFSHKPEESVGFEFAITAADALEAFTGWVVQNTPLNGHLIKPEVTIAPTILPFYAFDLRKGSRLASASSNSDLLEYAGHSHNSLLVQSCLSSLRGAIPFDARRVMMSKGNDVDKTVIDPWSMLPSAALKLVKARLEEPDFAVTRTVKAHLPAYIVHYTYLGQSWPVCVCGRTGKASGLKHSNPLSTVARMTPQLPYIFWIFLIAPRLIPPLGIGVLAWSVLTTLFPIVADRIHGAVRQAIVFDPKSVSWLKDLYSTYDASSSRHESGHQEQSSDWWQQSQQQQQRQQRTSAGSSSSSTSSSRSTTRPSLTHYQVLNIPRTANASQIKEAYRRQVLLKHPDQNKSPTAADDIKQVLDAYRTLSNPEKKRAYDSTL